MAHSGVVEGRREQQLSTGEMLAVSAVNSPSVLHGFFRSSAAWRVRIALNLKGVPVSQVSHHLPHMEQTAPDYLALNPQGLVPALTLAADTVLTQSLAIIEWLDEG